jgi:hypothetical protein
MARVAARVPRGAAVKYVVLQVTGVNIDKRTGHVFQWRHILSAKHAKKAAEEAHAQGWTTSIEPYGKEESP